MNEQPNSIEQLVNDLATILISWPLYRTHTYYGDLAHTRHVKFAGVFLGQLPKHLKMFCNNDHCKQETWWETADPTFNFGDHFITEVTYQCRNCGKNSTYYEIIWQRNNGSNVFLKVGQYPELEERIPASLENALDKADLKLYKNAIRMRNFNFGLAAVAYMRRIVENK